VEVDIGVARLWGELGHEGSELEARRAEREGVGFG